VEVLKSESEIVEFVVERGQISYTTRESADWCKVVELKSEKVVRKFKVKNVNRRFLVWQEAVFY